MGKQGKDSKAENFFVLDQLQANECPLKTSSAFFYTKRFLTISLQCLSYVDTEFHLLIKHNWATFQKDEQSLFCCLIQKLGLVWVTVFVSICFQALKGWTL